MLKMLSLIRHILKPSSTSSLHLTSKLPLVFQLSGLLMASIFLNCWGDSQSGVCDVGQLASGDTAVAV